MNGNNNPKQVIHDTFERVYRDKPHKGFTGGPAFDRLRCACGATAFEVLNTSDGETAVECIACGGYYAMVWDE